MLSKLALKNAVVARVAGRRFMSAWPDPHASGHKPNPEFWKKVFFYVSVPAIILSALNTYFLEKEHNEHYVRPKFIPYEHLRIRTRRFPWGDGNKSLFHNPETNPLPDGYEDGNNDGGVPHGHH